MQPTRPSVSANAVSAVSRREPVSRVAKKKSYALRPRGGSLTRRKPVRRKVTMSNLQTRILTAIVLGAVALWLTWIGGVGFTLFSIVIGLAMFYEWTGLTASRQTSFSRSFGWGWLVLTGVLLVLDRGALLTIGVLLAGVVVLLATQWKTGRAGPRPAFYAGFSAISLSLLRGDEPFGFTAIIFLLPWYGPRILQPISMAAPWEARNSLLVFTQQDLVGCDWRCRCGSCRRHSGRFARGCAWQLGRAASCAFAVGDFADRRPCRVMGKAPVRSKGFGPFAAGPWRSARPR